MEPRLSDVRSTSPWLVATFFCAPSSSFYLGFISCLGTSKVIFLSFHGFHGSFSPGYEGMSLQNIRQPFFFPCHHRKVYGTILLSARPLIFPVVRHVSTDFLCRTHKISSTLKETTPLFTCATQIHSTSATQIHSTSNTVFHFSFENFQVLKPLIRLEGP